MASALYDTYKQDCLDRSTAVVDLDTTAQQTILVHNTTSGYTFAAAHDFRDDVAGANAVVDLDGDAALASKTVTNGAFDAADQLHSAVSGSFDVESVVVYQVVGSAATDDLVIYIDGFTAVTPNGGDITIQWGTSIFTF